jgi:hypothetical protein
MARNYKFFFDQTGTPRARGPAAEKPLMTYLELDVQGSDHICRDLMDDLTAIEDESDDSREFIGNAHCIQFTPECVLITVNQPPEEAKLASGASTADSSDATSDTSMENKSVVLESLTYEVGLKRFREVLEDWEAFILDDQIDDSLSEDDYL